MSSPSPEPSHHTRPYLILTGTPLQNDLPNHPPHTLPNRLLALHCTHHHPFALPERGRDATSPRIPCLPISPKNLLLVSTEAQNCCVSPLYTFRRLMCMYQNPNSLISNHFPSSTKPRDRSEHANPPTFPATSLSPRKPHATPTPALTSSNNTQDAGPDKFSRQLEISTSPQPSPRPHQKLYNPNTGTIPMRHRRDSDLLLEHPQSHLSPRPAILSRAQPHSPQRKHGQKHQLFDHPPSTSAIILGSSVTCPVRT